jgi:hypothetical protein
MQQVLHIFYSYSVIRSEFDKFYQFIAGREQTFNERLERTEMLDLQANPIDDEGFKALLPIGDIDSLARLNLSDTEITGDSIELLVDRWKKFKQGGGLPVCLIYISNR